MTQAAIIGGGFYGACIGLYLQKMGMKVTIFEKSNQLMSRASLINQARVHAGFHYPRNITTAYRSLINYPQFVNDFALACKNDYQSLYCVAKNNSKIFSSHFYNLYKKMGAEITDANSADYALFDPNYIDKVFNVREIVFDAKIVKSILEKRLNEANLNIKLNSPVHHFSKEEHGYGLFDESQNLIANADFIFNCTYSALNIIRSNSNLMNLPIKNQMTEMALLSVPAVLQNKAITIIDGPFFSIMPYPSLNLHTLSHVRYTPHCQWQSIKQTRIFEKQLEENKIPSQYRYMMNDAIRYMPILNLSQYCGSLFEIKSLLLKNEMDDGRPILFHEEKSMPGVFTVLGGKIDNIYDLIHLMNKISYRFNINESKINDLFVS